MLQKNDGVELKFAAQLDDQGLICFENKIYVVGGVDVTRAVGERALIHFLNLFDHSALFR